MGSHHHKTCEAEIAAPEAFQIASAQPAATSHRKGDFNRGAKAETVALASIGAFIPSDPSIVS